MTQPRCSIIIRSYNEEKHIARLLEGIAQQTLQDVEVILVDSGSKDRTVDIAQRYAVNVVRIKPEEFTFGRSLNRGIQAASGEILVFASAHVYPVYPDWLEKLLAPFADPKIALVYGKQRGGETTKYSEEQIFASCSRKARKNTRTVPSAITPTPRCAARLPWNIPTTKRCPAWKTWIGQAA